MRNKSPLALMEQVLMVLIFALAAALCLQGFVLANRISERMETQNCAVTLAQNAAEMLKYYSGDPEKTAQQLETTRDGDMLLKENLQLKIVPVDSAVPLLGAAKITVLQKEEILFEITVAWQEEDPYAEK